MPKYRVKKYSYDIAPKRRRTFKGPDVKALLKRAMTGVCALFGGLGRWVFAVFPRKAGPSVTKRPSLRRSSSGPRTGHLNSAKAFTGSNAHSPGKRRMLRIKNPRRVLAASGALAALMIAIVLIAALTGGETEQAALRPGASSSPGQTPYELASVSLVMPVYDPIQLKEGVNASVVTDVKQRLMDLGFMGVDETNSVFDDQTTMAINRFKEQHELTGDGVVDDQTYSLLFSNEAQYYTLSAGAKDTDEDSDIKELQQRLVELGYLDKATGYFGTDTENAVKRFQQRNGLAEDGRIGQDAREKLYSDDVIANFFSSGDKNDEILACQQRLKTLGYLKTKPDGRFGADTKTAVKLFQETNGLIADGYIGPATKKALVSNDAQVVGALSVGSRGDRVTTAQEKLKSLGYLKSNATGYFGSDTEKAVRSFQKTNNLSVDGKVGRDTWNKLMTGKPKKAPSGSSEGSDGSGGSDPVITGPNIESFISAAESKLGCKYVRGGKGPKTFDCSGLVYWCLNKVGVKQSYMTSYTWRSCTKYDRIENMSDLKRGDVIVYNGHVAICAGNGYMIDASSSNKKVVKRKYTGSSYWSTNFICGFRIF